MSNVSTHVPDIDIWEFVHCGHCHLPFVPQPGAAPLCPFWVTECGHIICNNHINADQSCGECGREGIQLAPLQFDMEPPMSDWFSFAVPVLESATYAARFQMEMLVSSVRYYKNKCMQQRSVLDRLKTELANYKTLQRDNQALRLEIDQLRQNADRVHDGSDPAMNGKRRRIEEPQYLRGNGASLSPRSVVTPVGPDRLTLGPDQRQSNFSSRQSTHSLSDNAAQPQRATEFRSVERATPGPSIEQYAYFPPGSQQSRSASMQTLSHEQLRSSSRPNAQVTQGQAHTSMPLHSAGRENQMQFHPGGQTAAPHRLEHKTSNRTQMLPPPTPQMPLTPRSNLHNSNFRPSTGQPLATGAVLPSRQFIPSTPTKNGTANSMYTMSTPRRFIPQQGIPQNPSSLQSSNRQMSVSGLAPNLHSSLSGSASASAPGGQRMPFIGSSRNSFG